MPKHNPRHMPAHLLRACSLSRLSRLPTPCLSPYRGADGAFGGFPVYPVNVSVGVCEIKPAWYPFSASVPAASEMKMLDDSPKVVWFALERTTGEQGDDDSLEETTSTRVVFPGFEVDAPWRAVHVFVTS
jgi:hypothetical protein